MQPDAHQQLISAVRTKATKTMLLDREDGQFLYIEYSWWAGWIVSRYSIDDMNRARSDLNLGQTVTTLPTRYFGFRRSGKPAFVDSPLPVRIGVGGKLERVEQPPVSVWQQLRATVLEARLLRPYSSREEVRELAGQLRRAEPLRPYGGSDAA